MTVRYVSGDLFTNRHNAQAFAHGCNCRGAMGAGIAKGFRERDPEMYEEYRRSCKADPREFNPGDSHLWKDDERPWVFNLATQEDYWRSRATCGAVEKALEAMKRQADEEGIRSIAMPRIGAGYGGLPWEKVRPVIERIFSDWPGMVHVYETYILGKQRRTVRCPVTAIEIETGMSDVEGNIDKCREAGFDEIIVVFTSAEATKRLSCSVTDLKSVHPMSTSGLLR